jgi:hypothetical protein
MSLRFCALFCLLSFPPVSFAQQESIDVPFDIVRCPALRSSPEFRGGRIDDACAR